MGPTAETDGDTGGSGVDDQLEEKFDVLVVSFYNLSARPSSYSKGVELRQPSRFFHRSVGGVGYWVRRGDGDEGENSETGEEMAN